MGSGLLSNSLEETQLGASSFLQRAPHFLLILPSFHLLGSPSLPSARILPHFLPSASFVLNVLAPFLPTFLLFFQISAEKQNISGASLNKFLPTEPEPLLQRVT